MTRFTILVFFLLIYTFSFAQKQLALTDFVIDNTFDYKTVDGLKPMNNGDYYSIIKDGQSIVKCSYKTGEEIEILFSLTDIIDCPIDKFSDYTFSSDEKRILLETNKTPIYRRSYTADYYIWDQYTETLSELSEYGSQQAATFSPNAERVAFVRNNNIFIKTIRFGTEQQVTNDGQANKIINGVPDWVYEEEFAYNCAFEWSPNSDKLAFVKFDETEVNNYSMPVYKGLAPEKTEYALYPGFYTFKYPKAGQNNSKVSAHIFDVKTRTTIEANIKNTDENYYLPRIHWAPNGENLAIFVLNRQQNELQILYANPYTGDTRTLITERNKKYIETDFLSNFRFLDNKTHFVVLSERSGWSHLYLYKNNGFIEKQITSGNFDVTAFYGYNQSKDEFYYQAAKISPLQREIYSISGDGKKQQILSPDKGTNKAVFSNNFNYFVNYSSSSTTPPRVDVFNYKAKAVRTIEENTALAQKITEYAMPSHNFFTINTTQGVKLNAYMLKPYDFDSTKRYPVIMYQYSGPNSQEVTDQWNIDWHYYLAQQGYIVACVDPRGTAARGEEFRKCTYMQLGKLESDDQIEAAKYLASLPYIDQNKIGIWGWSFGGFTTALSMGKNGNIFKAGVAVAPVTNWRYYDTAYTERYMRTPLQNPGGYDDNSPINNIEYLTGNLLLIHGTADDNVHAQNVYEYSEALVQKGIQFDMHIYTNRNHSITGGNTRMHLYTKILRHFDKNLK